jgi:hypothetical protein
VGAARAADVSDDGDGGPGDARTPRERAMAILADLRVETGARRAAVLPRGAPDPVVTGVGGLRVLPLGGGARLHLELGPMGRIDDEVDLALERAVRALREVARASEAPLPACEVALGAADRTARVALRVHEFLVALGAIQGAENVLCMLHGALVASARPPSELELGRAELLVRRCEAAARARQVGHTDLADADAFVLTFWHRAALLVYFAGPYAVDFVRHRARQVARELARLLPELEPDPSAPAALLPPPT